MDNGYNEEKEKLDTVEKCLERIRELEREVEKEREANRSKNEFIARLSHDIRTPAGAICNLAQFALVDMDNAAALKKDIERIDLSGRFLVSLVDDALDISEIESGRMRITPSRTSYKEYLKELRNIIVPMCEQKDIHCRIIVQTKATPPDLYADFMRIKQILINVISNAVKYTPPGGTITYRSEGHIDASGKAVFGFTVNDTGIGMTDDFKAHVFEKFAQDTENPYRNKNEIGSGLGLFITKRMVDLLGGSISVHSRLGGGTSVTVRLPYELPQDAENAHSSEAESDMKSDESERKFSGRVLLAEDNEINTEIAMRVFCELGLDVLRAENGEKAVELFEQSAAHEIDVIFMDLRMPVMNGFEAAKNIRSMADERDDARTVPIIAMTADVYRESEERAEDAGMNEFLTKPLNISDIETALKKYLK